MSQHKFPWNYIPLFIDNKQEINNLIHGSLTLFPRIDKTRYEAVIAHISDNGYLKQEIEEQIENGCIVNFSEMLTVGRSLYPLEFKDGHFIKLDEKYRNLGDTALLILYPHILLQAMNQFFYSQNPHFYEAIAIMAHYVDKFPDDNFEASDVLKADGWKKEILLLAESRQDIAHGKMDYPNPINLQLDCLTDIAVPAPIDDLIEGKFPADIRRGDYIRYVQSFQPRESEITGYHKSFMAEVMDVIPTMKWIDELRCIFPKDEWCAISYAEKLRQDGASLPRLSFQRAGRIDRVRIGINSVSFDFAEYGEEEYKIVNQMVDYAYDVSGKRLSGLKASMDADVGILGEGYDDFIRLDETFEVLSGGLVFKHSLITDSRFAPGIFGVSVHKSSWHYTVSVNTPENERIRWYSPDDTMSFYRAQDQKCHSYVEMLLAHDDPYMAYQDLKKKRGRME